MNYEEKVIETIEKVMPATVSIMVGRDYNEMLRDRPYELMVQHKDHLDLPPPEEELPHIKDGKVRIGGGSGFLVDPTGLIITNKHVVSDTKAEYIVTTFSEDVYVAKVLARDPMNDVAILKIDGENPFSFLPLSTSTIRLGQTVIAVGTALGEFQNTVSRGIVSGLSRFIMAMTDMEGNSERLRGLIQTDAAINPGNSGGPLVNLDGEAIGINSAIIFGAQNIGFAIPIDKVRRDLKELKEFGRIRRPFLGVRYIMVTPAIQKKYRLPISDGALVLREDIPGHVAVLINSPADRGGVKESDVIVQINDLLVSEEQSIEDILEKVVIGDTFLLKVFRNGKEESLTLTAEERPETT